MHFSDLFSNLARACLASWTLKLEFPSGSESCEYVWWAQSHSGVLDRETGPDLIWQWTLAVRESSCAPRSRASFKNVSTKLSSINNKRKKKKKESRATPGSLGQFFCCYFNGQLSREPPVDCRSGRELQIELPLPFVRQPDSR